MSSGGGVNTEDTAYNSRMANISEEQQDIANRIFGKWAYGVPYDIEEDVVGYYQGGKFVEVPGATRTMSTAGKHAGTYTYSGLPPGVQGATMKRGELEGYNPDDYISEMDLMDKQIQDAFGLTDDETAAIRSQLSLQTATNEAGQQILPSQTEAAIAGNQTVTAEMGARQQVLPSETSAAISGNELTTAQNVAESGLVTPRAELEAAEIGETRQQIGARSPIIGKYYDEAGKKINVTNRMNEASGDVAQAYGAQRESIGRNVALRGGNIMSGSGRAMLSNLSGEAIKADAFARTNARRTAENEQLNRYRDALTLGNV